MDYGLDVKEIMSGSIGRADSYKSRRPWGMMAPFIDVKHQGFFRNSTGYPLIAHDKISGRAKSKPALSYGSSPLLHGELLYSVLLVTWTSEVVAHQLDQHIFLDLRS